MIKLLKTKLRREVSKQNSGLIYINKIKHLKENHYFIKDIALDGEAPKQYIHAYFYYKNCPRKSEPKNWDEYFAKFGGKSYPHESVHEFLINKIGDYLGLKMNDTKLVVANGQIRFLSKNFIESDKVLIHGIEILSDFLSDEQFILDINKDIKHRKEYLTFEEIELAIGKLYSREFDEIISDLIKMICFDAITGNADRHFYNWGIIGNTISSKKGVEFSPIYDSARALFWNFTDDKLKGFIEQYAKDKGKRMDSYLNKATPGFSFEENPLANHFELIEYLCKRNEKYEGIIKELLTVKKEKDIYSGINSDFKKIIPDFRLSIIKEVIKLRFKKLREISNVTLS